MLFDNLIGALEDFQRNTDEIVISVAADQANLIAELNEERIGEDNRFLSGAFITPDYLKSTQKRKGFKTPDLYETGAFLSDITVEIIGDSLRVYSRDRKYEQGLISKYEKDGDLFGLSENGKDIVANAMMPDLINEFRKIVFA